MGVSNIAGADDTSTADPGDAAPGTADMTSQNPTASAMNPSRLLRTTLFSALALLVMGAFLPAQAQDIVVDNRAGTGDFNTIQAGLNNASAGETVKVVEGNGSAYSPGIIETNNVTLQLGANVEVQADGNDYGTKS